MNQHTPDARQDGSDESPRAKGDPGMEKDVADLAPDPAGDTAVAGNVDAGEPVAATLVETADHPPIRVGSPFAVDPVATQVFKRVELVHDVGPIRYTAMGAVAASVMVLAFAGTAAWWFPAGGALIASLGCVLSIFGLYSSYRVTSAGLLAVHLCLFVVSYGRSLG